MACLGGAVVSGAGYGSSKFFMAAILVVLMFSSYCFTISNASIFYFKRYHIHVLSKIDEQHPVHLHCKSADTDFGEHIMPYGDTFYFHFRLNYFQTTLYWCNSGFYNSTILTWHVKSFNIYEARSGEGGQDKFCYTSQCHWEARVDGWYVFDVDTRKFILAYPWEIDPAPPVTFNKDFNATL